MPPELDADSATYRRRVAAAEAWASSLYAASLEAAKAHLHVGRRAARYRDLEPYFLDQLASPSRAWIEGALHWVLETIEAETYGIPASDVLQHIPPHYVDIVREGLKCTV